MSVTWPIGTRDTMRDGTIIEVANELEKGRCRGCFFYSESVECTAPLYVCECLPAFRDDHTGIIFKKIGHINRMNHGKTSRN